MRIRGVRVPPTVREVRAGALRLAALGAALSLLCLAVGGYQWLAGSADAVPLSLRLLGYTVPAAVAGLVVVSICDGYDRYRGWRASKSAGGDDRPPSEAVVRNRNWNRDREREPEPEPERDRRG